MTSFRFVVEYRLTKRHTQQCPISNVQKLWTRKTSVLLVNRDYSIFASVSTAPPTTAVAGTKKNPKQPLLPNTHLTHTYGSASKPKTHCMTASIITIDGCAGGVTRNFSTYLGKLALNPISQHLLDFLDLPYAPCTLLQHCAMFD
jgi:hypothetical protein